MQPHDPPVRKHGPLSATFADSARVRLPGLFLLYAAQGAPEGLLYVAVPAWLAAQGVSAEAIGAYIAVILLPWSFKLFNGVIMDRVTFLPMGRRRPWVLAAQALLLTSMVAFGVNAPEGADLVYITAAGFLVNFAGAFQDVAIDGMAIDVVPEDERARANGVMWGGKTLGIAAASAVTGHVISQYGFAAAALTVAAFVGVVFLVPLFVRERAGERLLPWTRGEAAPSTQERQARRWRPIIVNLVRELIKPRSLLLAAGIFIALISYGLDTAYGPVLAVQELNWTEAGYGNLAGASNLAGGVFGVLVAGILADWMGARRAVIVSLVLMGVAQIAMALMPGAWADPLVFGGYTMIYAVLFVLASVSIYALAMSMSAPIVGATQFAVYMAVLNLGTSFGAQQLGGLREGFGYEGAFLAGGAAAVLAAAVFAIAGRLRARD